MAGPALDEALCPICLDVIEEPRKLNGCDHHFCKACIREWLRTETTCPTCRTNGVIVQPDTTIVDHIRALPVKCFYRNMGCHVFVPLSNMHIHTSMCGYRPVSCDRNCGEILAIRNMPTHLLTCVNRIDPFVASLMCYVCKYEYHNGLIPTHCDYTDLVDQMRNNGLL